LKRVQKKEIGNQDEGFTISQAIPIDNVPEKARRKQKRQYVQIDDRYISEHYYSNESANILHEKDGRISKLKQFDYKVHKFNKNRRSE